MRAYAAYVSTGSRQASFVNPVDLPSMRFPSAPLAEEGSKTRAAATFWDENRAKATDPTYWMAHPLCRQAINRRISGSPHEWPLDWFRRVHAPRGFGVGLSFGCGMGAFERAAMRIGLVREIDAFDISTASLADAKREADREGLTGINYMVGSFDDPHLVRHRYDIVFFHASLHHVSALERLFRRLSVALKPHGAIYVDEYVGPSRHDWRPEDLQLAQALLDLLPPAAKVGHTIDLPIQMDDPSEAVRSSEIRRFVQDFFRMIEWRPYGGQVVDLIFPYLDPAWASSPEGIEAIGSLLRVEDWALSLDTSLSHYAVGYGFLRPLPALIRPLARQGVAAVRRRLPTFS